MCGFNMAPENHHLRDFADSIDSEKCKNLRKIFLNISKTLVIRLKFFMPLSQTL